MPTNAFSLSGLSDFLSTALTSSAREALVAAYYPSVVVQGSSAGAVVKALDGHDAIDDVLFDILSERCSTRVHEVTALHTAWKELVMFGSLAPPDERTRVSIRVDAEGIVLAPQQLIDIVVLLKNITRDYALTVRQSPPGGAWIHVTTNESSREHLRRLLMDRQLRFLGDLRVLEAMAPADSVYEFMRTALASETADLRFARLRDVVMIGARVAGARMDHADLGHSMCFGSALLDTSLRHARLRGADLNKAKFRGSDLLGADFLQAELVSADFTGANLRGVNFARANLRGSKLSGAALEGAHLHETVIGEEHAPLLSRAQLAGALIRA
jgi:hypothetical protein